MVWTCRTPAADVIAQSGWWRKATAQAVSGRREQAVYDEPPCRSGVVCVQSEGYATQHVSSGVVSKIEENQNEKKSRGGRLRGEAGKRGLQGEKRDITTGICGKIDLPLMVMAFGENQVNLWNTAGTFLQSDNKSLALAQMLNHTARKGDAHRLMKHNGKIAFKYFGYLSHRHEQNGSGKSGVGRRPDVKQRKSIKIDRTDHHKLIEVRRCKRLHQALVKGKVLGSASSVGCQLILKHWTGKYSSFTSTKNWG